MQPRPARPPCPCAQAAAKAAPQLSRDQMTKLRQQHDPNFSAKAGKPVQQKAKEAPAAAAKGKKAAAAAAPGAHVVCACTGAYRAGRP